MLVRNVHGFRRPPGMTRRAFVGGLAAGGLVGCSASPDIPMGSFGGSVLVIGAGAAGISAAHFLDRAGVDVTVLEASGTHGGRIKTARDFVDFPIPLGGEWLHTGAHELDDLTGSTDHGIQVAAYGDVETFGSWQDGTFSVSESEGASDLKFVGRTWLDVFEEFLLPPIAGRIQFNSVVDHIDYSADTIVVATQDGRRYTADRVIITAPIVQLRDHIRFTPELPRSHRDSLDSMQVWGGFKAFLHFDERFYPGAFEIAGASSETGQLLFYDAAHGQASDANVLGLFSVGTGSMPYQQAHSRGELIEFLLAQLDQIFAGKASTAYLQHIAQDWDKEPHIGMAYLADNADWRGPQRLSLPIQERIYFAGDAYIADAEGWSMVHLAARSARRAVQAILV